MSTKKSILGQIGNTRELIKKGKFEEAFDLLSTFVPEEYESFIVQLNASFEIWKRNFILGTHSDFSQRDIAVYGMLEILSSIELDIKPKRTTRFRRQVEENIKNGNIILSNQHHEFSTQYLDEVHSLLKLNSKIYKLLKFNAVFLVISFLYPIIWGKIEIELLELHETEEYFDSGEDIDIDT